MLIAGALVLVVLIGITLSAVIMFGWAAENGQFQHPEQGAASIFDADEPVGKSTDHFPHSKS